MQEMLSQFESFWALAGLILGFGFLIFIHELGHFLVAKWVGIKVTQFAIGFGHCVISWRQGIGFCKGSSEPEYEKRLKEGANADSLGETEYRLNWMPLGGYVKMLGQEDLDPTAISEDERSFNRQPIWARACVVSAGVVMNLIFGAIFFVIAFMAGVEFPPAIVGGVLPGSPAALAQAQSHADDPAYHGLKPGDRITYIDGQAATDFTDVAVQTALANREQVLEFTIVRDGEDSPLVYAISPKEDSNTQLLAIGVARPVSLEIADPGKGQLLPGMLQEAGVTPGMKIVQVDGQPIERFDQFDQAVSSMSGQPVAVILTHPETGQTATALLSAIPGLAGDADQPANLIGLVPAIEVIKTMDRSPAAAAGLKAGDVLASIGPIPWPTGEDIIQAVDRAKGQSIQVTVLRDGELVDLQPVTPTSQGKIGIYFGLALNVPIVSQTLPNTPGATLNLNAGSRVLSIDGQPVAGFGDIQRLLAQAVLSKIDPGVDPGLDEPEPGLITDPVTVQIGYQPNIANAPITQTQVLIDPQTGLQLADAAWNQPLSSSTFKMLMISLAADNPVAAFKLGVKKTNQVMQQTYITLLRLFQGTVKASHLRGPLGIADDGANFAKQGWSYLMFFLGIISVNLVVINFLPIPIVDGGLMVFLIVEKIKGSPVSVRIQNAATIVGLAMIGSVFLLTLFYDAKRLMGM